MNPYSPDESPSQLFAEKTWLQGALLSNIVYGVELTLFAMCFDVLIRHKNRHASKINIFLLVFVTVIFILGTIFMISLADFTQLAFINDRDFPGGPGAYEEAMFWIPVDEMGNAAFVLSNWFMDLLLVWRCMVIYKGASTRLLAVIIIPWLLFAASFTLGVVFLVQTSTSSPFSAVNFTLAYFVMTLSLNIVVTILIAARLFHLRRLIKRAMGDEHSSHANMAAILVESAALYSAFAILFLVPFGLNYPLAQVFLQTMGQVQTVSSLLIIFRLAIGKGWTERTFARLRSVATDPISLKAIPDAKSFANGSRTAVLPKGLGDTPSVNDANSDLGVVRMMA